MATGKVTLATVKAMAPGKGDAFLWDTELKGFGLKVTPAGARSYVFQYRMGGRGTKTKRYTIGGHGSPWTPDSARDECKRLSRLVSQGTDPAQAKRERERQSVTLAFRGYAETFVDEYLKANWPGSWADGQNALRFYAVAELKDKSVGQIERADIKAVLDRAKGMPATQRKLFAILRLLFSWAVDQGDIVGSPVDAMKAPAGPSSRDRVLADWELRLAWLAASGLGYPFGPLIRLLIATGQRLEEVAALDWKEVDKAHATWDLPSERAKNDIAHHVPLNARALAELEAISRRRVGHTNDERWPRRGFVFTTTGETSVSGYSRAKKRLDAAMMEIAQKEAIEREEDPKEVEIAAWRLHDLRRTLATGFQRLGIRFEVTEAVLNHVSGAKSGVAGVYQRYDWRPEKRAALDAWAAHLDALATGQDQTNVVQLAAARA